MYFRLFEPGTVSIVSKPVGTLMRFKLNPPPQAQSSDASSSKRVRHENECENEEFFDEKCALNREVNSYQKISKDNVFDISGDLLDESFASLEYSEDSLLVPFHLASNSVAYSGLRRHMNKQRFPEFGPDKELILQVPDESPSCYLMRFSQSGKFLLAFGSDCRFLIYPLTYRGSFFQSPKSFYDFFSKAPVEIDIYSANRLVPGTLNSIATMLCRDFCLTLKCPMTNRDRYVILAASTPSQVYEVQDRPPQSLLFHASTQKQYKLLNDSHTAFPCLDHVTFFLVSLFTMKVVDFVSFKYDFIYLAHHLGVGLFEGLDRTTFSVLSMKNQRVLKFDIDFERDVFQEPTFSLCRNSLDELVEMAEGEKEPYSMQISESLPASDPQSDASWGQGGVDGLMRKICNYLMLELKVPCPALESLLEHLHIWKHEAMTDGRHVLLRIAASSVILSTNPRHQSTMHAIDPLPGVHQHSFIVLWDESEARVVSIVNSADQRLTDWFLKNFFRYHLKSFDSEGLETMENLFARFCNLDSGGSRMHNTFHRRISNLFPLAPQRTTQSPLLDSAVFRWDCRLTVALYRQNPLSCTYFNNTDLIINATGLQTTNFGADPVRFFSRQRPELLSHTFQLAEPPNGDPNDSANAQALDRHRWCNILIHPTMPLMLVYQYGLFRSLTIRIFYH